MTDEKAKNPCTHECHGDPEAPVRHCPDCGEAINELITMRRCNEIVHEKGRVSGWKFCTNCGRKL